MCVLCDVFQYNLCAILSIVDQKFHYYGNQLIDCKCVCVYVLFPYKCVSPYITYGTRELLFNEISNERIRNKWIGRSTATSTTGFNSSVFNKCLWPKCRPIGGQVKLPIRQESTIRFHKSVCHHHQQHRRRRHRHQPHHRIDVILTFIMEL